MLSIYETLSTSDLLTAVGELGVGSTAFYSSMNALVELQLVSKQRKKQTTLHTLTPKGKAIADLH